MPDIEGQQEPVFRVFCGTPEVVVAQVNAALKDYVVVNWSWSVIKDQPHLSALLISQREVRKAQLAQAGIVQNNIRR